MTKTTKLHNFDTEIYQIFEEKVGKGNVSKTLRRFMEEYLDLNVANVTDLAKAEEYHKNIQETHTAITAELTKAKQDLKEAKKRHKAELEEEKKRMAEMAQKAAQCANCGNVISGKEKPVDLGKGHRVHNHCFLVLKKADIDRILNKDVEV